MTYSDKLKDPRWQRKRLQILERDEFTCRDCHSKDKTLHVHHCHYEKGEPWDARNELLLTLCDDCHKERGSLEAEAKLFLAQIMARLPNGPDEADLKNFYTGLQEQAQEDDLHFGPEVISNFNLEWESDIRWFRYACDHPEARPFYEAVAGRNPGANWNKIWNHWSNEQPA